MVACDEWSTIHEWAKAFGPQTRLYASCFPVQNLKWYPLGHSRRIKITRFRTEKRLRLPLQVVPPSVGVAEFSGIPNESQVPNPATRPIHNRISAPRISSALGGPSVSKFQSPLLLQISFVGRCASARPPHRRRVQGCRTRHTTLCIAGAWASRQCLQLILSA